MTPSSLAAQAPVRWNLRFPRHPLSGRPRLRSRGRRTKAGAAVRASLPSNGLYADAAVGAAANVRSRSVGCRAVEGRQSYRLTLGVLIMAALAYALQQTMVVPA